MKTVRIFSLALVLSMFMATVMPFAATPAAAREIVQFSADFPGQTISGIAGPSFSGLSHSPSQVAAASLPEVVLRVESNNGNYGCTLLRQSPGDWILMQPRQSFDVSWTVQNTGNAVWHASATKLEYVGGTKMQTHGDAIGLSNDVGRGGKVKLTVDMEAPKSPGVYSTLWALYSGNTQFCRVTLSLSVSR
ncbi:MAG TPA: NBR1-Ig-like domain-containing protein [Anaerolineales bacterium]|jgi:hypothetical protein